jgi:putative phosphoribosyl transferase
MIFKDRVDAGKQLAGKLKEYKGDENAIVVALPRGGVVLGYKIAKELNLPLDIVVPRKIGAPGNPEFACGAITEAGEYVSNPDAGKIPEAHIKSETEKEKQEAKRRLGLYRPEMPKRDFKGKIIILVDDGIATGLTMEAGIKTLKEMGAKEIIIAVPVSAEDSYQHIKKMVDKIICLEQPMFFGAVGQFYERFDQTEDKEVIELMKKANQ